MSSNVIETIVTAIINDISDRRGLKHAWSDIDDAARREIRQTWEKIVYEWLSVTMPVPTDFHDPRKQPDPIPMILFCPCCGERHIDEGAFATEPHKAHACQTCGVIWTPALIPTVGVRFLPGTKNP